MTLIQQLLSCQPKTFFYLSIHVLEVKIGSLWVVWSVVRVILNGSLRIPPESALALYAFVDTFFTVNMVHLYGYTPMIFLF